MQFVWYWQCRFLALLPIAVLFVVAGCGGSAQRGSTPAGTSTSSAVATVTPSTLSFGTQALNSTSNSGTITLTNTGTSNLTVNSVSVTGDFSTTNNCGTTLAASGSCTLYIQFKPTAVGSRTGVLSISDNAPQSPQQVAVTGTGVLAGQLTDSPTTISFGTVTVGQASSQTVAITNTGGQEVNVTSVSTNGPGLSVTGIATPLVLKPAQSTTLNVVFNPSAAGQLAGAVYIANDGQNSNLTIPATGAGVSSGHEVVLSWKASSSAAVGYNVYRGSISGGPYTKLTSSITSLTSYTDNTVLAGNSYYYVVTAVGVTGEESAFSTEVEALVPTP